jgi:membrane-associated phospholipid phosphatase
MKLGKLIGSELAYFWSSTLENWIEWLATFCLAASSGIIALSVEPREHLAFFENFNERYPYSGETIGGPILGIITVIIPSSVLGLIVLLCPRRIDLSLAGMSLAQALSLNMLITQALKVTVGRPRPNFFSYCGYDPEIKQCTAKALHRRDSRQSFPSGHASSSFAVATWMFLLIGSVIPRNTELWFVLLKMLPLFVATFVAASRITDYMHHVSDVVAGCVIGIGVATMIFSSQASRIFMATKKKVEDEEFDIFGEIGNEI